MLVKSLKKYGWNLLHVGKFKSTIVITVTGFCNKIDKVRYVKTFLSLQNLLGPNSFIVFV